MVGRDLHGDIKKDPGEPKRGGPEKTLDRLRRRLRPRMGRKPQFRPRRQQTADFAQRRKTGHSGQRENPVRSGKPQLRDSSHRLPLRHGLVQRHCHSNQRHLPTLSSQTVKTGLRWAKFFRGKSDPLNLATLTSCLKHTPFLQQKHSYIGTMSSFGQNLQTCDAFHGDPGDRKSFRSTEKIAHYFIRTSGLTSGFPSKRREN